MIIFETFHGLKNFYIKFQDFPSILFQDLYEPCIVHKQINIHTSGTGLSAICCASSIHAVNTGCVTSCSGRWNYNRPINHEIITLSVTRFGLVLLTSLNSYRYRYRVSVDTRQYRWVSVPIRVVLSFVYQSQQLQRTPVVSSLYRIFAHISRNFTTPLKLFSWNLLHT